MYVIIFRIKAYNVTQLVMYVAEAFEAYIKKRLLDVALGRRAPRKDCPQKVGHIDSTTVKCVGTNLYQVPSASMANKM